MRPSALHGPECGESRAPGSRRIAPGVCGRLEGSHRDYELPSCVVPAIGSAVEGGLPLGPIFLGLDGRRMDRYAADRTVKRLAPQGGDQQADLTAQPASLVHHRRT